MLTQLQQWLNDGTPRRTAHAGDTQYEDAAADVIFDQLIPALTRAFFDNVFAAGGVYQQDGAAAGYSVVPMAFAQEPNDYDAHDGTSYFDGWRGYDWKVLQDMLGTTVASDLSPSLKALLCGGAGIAGCGAAVDSALLTVYNQLAAINGSSTVADWTQDTQTETTGTTLPEYDDIQFTAIGVVGQPAINWQNRPTFQQVVEFPLTVPAAQTPETPAAPLLPLAGVSGVLLVAAVRRRVRQGHHEMTTAGGHRHGDAEAEAGRDTQSRESA
jgi:hypothetical protein